MTFQERGAEQIQIYLLVFLQLRQFWGSGRVLLRAGVPAQTLVCDLATSESQFPGQEDGAEGRLLLLCRVSVGISRRDALRAGGRRPGTPSTQNVPGSDKFLFVWLQCLRTALAIVSNIYCAVGGSPKDRLQTSSNHKWED